MIINTVFFQLIEGCQSQKEKCNSNLEIIQFLVYQVQKPFKACSELRKFGHARSQLFKTTHLRSRSFECRSILRSFQNSEIIQSISSSLTDSVNNILFKMCQKKRYELAYGILKEFL